MIDSVVDVFSLSLAFALIGLNVYISTRVMNITDITCDASVALGGCCYGAFVLLGMNPLVALVIAAGLGAIAGFVTSFFITNINIEPVLASIITLTAMQTFIMKLSSIKNGSFGFGLSKATFLTSLSAITTFIIVLIIVSTISFLLYRVLNSEYGLSMRVYGDGTIISQSLGINTDRMLWAGLGIGNALSAIAGALIAQITHNFCSGMGDGALVFGMAAIIIGERILTPRTIKAAIIGCFVGSFVYKALIGAAMFSGSEIVGSEYHGIVTAVVLIFLMASIYDNRRSKYL